MNFLIYFLQRTIGQKIAVGLSGLGLCLFLLVHMLGNLLILSGPLAYNRYAHKLHEIPLFLLAELGLLAFFAGHILLSLLLAAKNKTARGASAPQLKIKGGKRAPRRHHLLWLQGAVLLVFLGFHLWSFKFGPYYETVIDGQKARDIYRLVEKSFKNPLYIISYSLVLCVLCVHVLRGLPASFKSLGFSSLYMPFIEKFSWVFAFGVTLGFLAPIWYLFLYL